MSDIQPTPADFRSWPVPDQEQVFDTVMLGVKAAFDESVFGFCTDEPRDISLRVGDDEPSAAQVMLITTSDKHMYEVIVRDCGIHGELLFADEPEPGEKN